MTLKSFLKKYLCKPSGAPVVLISKDTEIKEFNCIVEAITDLEMNSNVSAEIIEKLRASVETLKNKGIIKIQNGEIIE